MVDQELAAKRIDRGECPICGNSDHVEMTIAHDAKFGIISMCQRHIERNNPKLLP